MTKRVAWLGLVGVLSCARGSAGLAPGVASGDATPAAVRKLAKLQLKVMERTFYREGAAPVAPPEAELEAWFTPLREPLADCARKAVKDDRPQTDELERGTLARFGFVVLPANSRESQDVHLSFRFGADGKISSHQVYAVGPLVDAACVDRVLRTRRFEGPLNSDLLVELWFPMEPVLFKARTLRARAREEAAQFCGWMEGLKDGRGPADVVGAIKKSGADGFSVAARAWGEREELSPFTRGMDSLGAVHPCFLERVLGEWQEQLGARSQACPGLIAWAMESAGADVDCAAVRRNGP